MLVCRLPSSSCPKSDRVGSSTDRADAAILAWHKRDQAIFMKKHGAEMRRGSFYAEYDPLGATNQGYEIDIFGGGGRDSYDVNPYG